MVISAFTRIGRNITLTSDNVIGGKVEVKKRGEFLICNNLNMGANEVMVGALSMVNKSFELGSILMGISVRNIGKIDVK